MLGYIKDLCYLNYHV